ncbi:MAG: hypothetical protein PF489_13545 [Salinivirgaceae bacterium]|jgi:IS30 family transposase|nr:hypothetical protein [Salinivirgaceae bacterium]
MNLTAEQYKEIEEYAGLFFSIDDIAVLIGCNATELRREIRNRNTEAYRYYQKGKLDTLVKIRKQTKLFAEKGSPQAEAFMKHYHEKMEGDE